ncbi:MAG: hypothetical protein NT145_07870 [Elusimicrobia bacterium]|nr:hypothetical protein [Elusimicrobiota bacterium]
MWWFISGLAGLLISVLIRIFFEKEKYDPEAEIIQAATLVAAYKVMKEKNKKG